MEVIEVGVDRDSAKLARVVLESPPDSAIYTLRASVKLAVLWIITPFGRSF